MKRTEFIERLINRGIAITPHNNLHGCPWDVRREYAELTKLIDFKCNFENGVCSEHKDNLDTIRHYKRQLRKYKDPLDRKETRSRLKELLQCCCTSCFSSIGHFECVNSSEISTLARHYREETGFWRQGKGCSLPRRLRSTTCLTYNCTNKYVPMVNLLNQILRTQWDGVSYPAIPEFIRSSYHKNKRKRWLTPEQFKEKILKEANK